MAPAVELSSSTFSRLQAHAIPLVDSIETVINRLIDFYESREGVPVPPDAAGGRANIRQFSPNAPPDLTHTKVLSAEFNGRVLDRGQTNWNGLLIAAVREAKGRARSLVEFKQTILVNHVSGQKNDEGYRHFPDLGISIQGQDANGAWRAMCHIAQQLVIPLAATFIWREKEGAAFPGVTGQFLIGGG